MTDELMPYMPTTKPLVTMLFADDVDRLWVGRTVTSDAPARWDVFDAEGEFIVAVRAPLGITTTMEPVLRGGRIYILATGDAGERYIVVAELPDGLR